MVVLCVPNIQDHFHNIYGTEDILVDLSLLFPQFPAFNSRIFCKFTESISVMQKEPSILSAYT